MMILPRALIALALGLSALAAVAPPTGTTKLQARASPGLTKRQDQANTGPSQLPRAVRNQRRSMHSLSAAELALQICPGKTCGCPIAEPGSLKSLPSSLSDWTAGGFECVDMSADLRACGGCASLDAKHDCTLIPGAKDVSCMSGVCVVDSCLLSHKIDSNKTTCIAI